MIKLFISDVDGTLTNGYIYTDKNGNQFKRFSVKDGYSFCLLKKAGILTCIITGNKCEIVKNRAESLKIDFYFEGIKDKLEFLNGLLTTLNIKFEEVAFIGDDKNDLPLIERVGISGCPLDAVNIIKKSSSFVSTYIGGKGAVREFAEMVIQKNEQQLNL